MNRVERSAPQMSTFETQRNRVCHRCSYLICQCCPHHRSPDLGCDSCTAYNTNPRSILTRPYVMSIPLQRGRPVSGAFAESSNTYDPLTVARYTAQMQLHRPDPVSGNCTVCPPANECRAYETTHALLASMPAVGSDDVVVEETYQPSKHRADPPGDS